MSRKRRMMQGALLSVLGVAVSMASMLLVGKVVTNALVPALVSIYALIRLGADFLTLFNNFGLSVSLPKLIGAEKEERRKGLLAEIFWGQSVVSLIFSLALLFIWRFVPDEDLLFPNLSIEEVWPFVWLVMLLLFVGTLRDTLLAGLAGMNAYGIRASGIMFMGVAQVVLVLGALWYWPGSVSGVCIALGIGYGSGVILMGVLSGLPLRVKQSFAAYRGGARFSFPLYVNSLVTFFALRFDTVLVGILLGKNYLGIIAIYEMAKYIPMVLSRGLGAMLIPFLPNFSELVSQGELKKAAELLNHALPLTAFAGYSVMFAAVIVQEPLLSLLFTKEYVSAAPVLGLLLVGIVLAVQAGLMGQALIALEHTWHVATANMSIAGLSIAANIILIPRLGLPGAGWAMVGAFALGYGLQYVWVKRAGIEVSLRAFALPQICLGLSAVILFWQPDALWVRIAALLCFVGLSFALRIVRISDVQDWLQAMKR